MIRSTRLAVDLRGRPELGDAALVQRRRVAAEEQRFGRLGGRVDDDAVAAGEELRQLVAQLLAQLVVEVGERLVEEDEVGILDEGARDRGALLLAAGKLVRAAAAASASGAAARRPARRARSISAAPHAGDAQRRGDVLEDREIRVVDELLVDHGDVALLHGNAGDVLAAEPDFAARSAARGRPSAASAWSCRRAVVPSRMLKVPSSRTRFVSWMWTSAPTRLVTFFSSSDMAHRACRAVHLRLFSHSVASGARADGAPRKAVVGREKPYWCSVQRLISSS